MAPESVQLSSLRFLKSGGEPVRWSTIEAFEQRFGLSGVVVPGYGLGEATLGVSEHIPGERRPRGRARHRLLRPPRPRR